MRNLRLVATLVLALASSFCCSQKPKTVSGLVWSEHCGNQQKRYLGIQVIVEGSSVYESSIPICQTEYSSRPKTIVFHFAGGHTFQGEHRTSPDETIEGNIWLAGSDPGDILFGFSFANKKRTLLNTVHVAKSDSKSASEIDRGIQVRTFPLRGKSQPAR